VGADDNETRKALAEGAEVAATAEAEVDEDGQPELLDPAEEREEEVGPVIVPVRVKLDSDHATGAPEALELVEHTRVVAGIEEVRDQEPVTREQYLQRSVRLPPQLFSHNDQTNQWLTLRGRQQLRSGWAGRVADALAGGLTEQQLATNVSLSGNSAFSAGEIATPYIMGATGAKEFTGFGNTGTNLQRQLAFERIAAADYNDVYARAYADVQRRAVLYAKQVNDTLEAAPALATGFNAQSALATQLKTVAKMIAVRDRLDMSRQIFFVATGGYDTHDDQLANQPGLLSDLSESLSAFYAATVELGVSQNVTTFTQSDFGRSLTSNGDGSDHAWGGVQLVVGDSVSGGTIYGQYPLLQIGSPLDVGGGRLIPSLSTHQYAATLSQWFGVPPDQLDAIAPDLLNFSPTNLGFLNA